MSDSGDPWTVERVAALLDPIVYKAGKFYEVGIREGVDLTPYLRRIAKTLSEKQGPTDEKRLAWLDSDAVRVARLHIESGYTGSLSGRNLAPFATLFLANDVFNGETVREVIDKAIAGKKPAADEEEQA